MIKYVVIFVAVLFAVDTAAQQQIHYTQFLQNKLWINPAYAGSHGHGTIQGIARNQWIGIDGAPKTAAISFHMPFENLRTGVGMTMTYDQIGPTTAYTFGGAYSYTLWRKNDRSLSAGLQASYTWWNIDFMGIETTTVGDGAFAINPERLHWLNFGLGLYYQSDNAFFGFSAPSLLQKNYFDVQSQDLVAQFERHWYIMGGGRFTIREDIDLTTGALIKYVQNTPLDLDINAILIWNQKLWTGLNWRMGNYRRNFSSESLDFILQYQLSDALRLGLAYDFTLTALDDLNDGTFELLVHWDLIRNVRNVKSIRYF